MTNSKEIYKCEICGNIIEVLHSGQGELICCNQPMKLQAPNTKDAAIEKHVPQIQELSEGVLIQIGEQEHPMTEEHFIEWIEIQTVNRSHKTFLESGQKPEAIFAIAKNKITKVRAYCNLHGLWENN